MTSEVAVGVTLGVGVGVRDGVGVSVGVEVAVAEAVGVSVEVEVAVGEAVAVGAVLTCRVPSRNRGNKQVAEGAQEAEQQEEVDEFSHVDPRAAERLPNGWLPGAAFGL